MRKLLKTSILVFAFCICAFAQTNNTSSCPTVSVIGPPGISALSEPIIFTASIGEEAENYNIKYNWTISSGKIVGGQGTSTLNVLYGNPGESITAQIEISGLPSGCANTAAEVYMYCAPRQPIELIQPSKIDEFTGSISNIENRKSEKLIKAMQDDPTAQLYVFVLYGKNNSLRVRKNRVAEISNLLVNENRIEAERINIVEINSNSDSYQFWLVPVGAIPPKIEDD